MKLSDLIDPGQAAALAAACPAPPEPTLDDLPPGGAWLPPHQTIRQAAATSRRRP